VVVVTGGTVSTHAVVALAATGSQSTNYGSTLGSITITGNGTSGYTAGQVKGLNGVTGNVNAATWASASDEEIYGVDVTVNGSQATAAQLATLINAIDGADGTPASGVAAVSTTDLSHGALSALDGGGTTYNLFLAFAPGFSPSANLGLDLSNTNDTNLVAYGFTAVSAVPEPVSLSVLALGGIGLMSRRSRRKI
jgi:hypothetical protein